MIKKKKINFFKSLEYAEPCRSTTCQFYRFIDLVRSQPPVEGRPKIKHNNPPCASPSEKIRLQTNALKTKLKIPSSTQS
jgi:hypothetical protein